MNIHQLQGQNTNNAHSVMVLTDAEKQVIQQHEDAEYDKFDLLCQKYGDNYLGEPFKLDVMQSAIARQFGVSVQDISIEEHESFTNFTGTIKIQKIPHAFALDQSAILSQLKNIQILRHLVVDELENGDYVSSNPMMYSGELVRTVDMLNVTSPDGCYAKPYQDVYFSFVGGKLKNVMYGQFLLDETAASVFDLAWTLDEIFEGNGEPICMGEYVFAEDERFDFCLSDLLNLHDMGDYEGYSETSMDFESVYHEVSSALIRVYRQIVLPYIRDELDRIIGKMENGDKIPVNQPIHYTAPVPIMTVPTRAQMLSMREDEHEKMLADKVQKAADHRAQKNYALMHDDRPWAR